MNIPRQLKYLVLVCLALLTGCVLLVRRIDVNAVARPADAAVHVTTPVKAHLRDGSVIVFAAGVTVTPDSLLGMGQRYDLRLAAQGQVRAVDMDSVLGLESFTRGYDAGSSVLLSVPATLATGFGAFALAKAIFGSCPTYYTDSAGARVLEAEGFSYSIAPIFESRDVDRLRGRPRAGALDVHVLNETLETHYINHIEVLAVPHAADHRALPDPHGRTVLVSGERAPSSAHDASRRRVLRQLRAADDVVFSSDPTQLRRVSTASMHDHIELSFHADDGVTRGDSAALVLQLRNSLLSTILLYDLMLGDAGARALDWVGVQLEQVGSAAELGRWYADNMGMRIEVADEAGWRIVSRLPDTGPLAWKEVAIMIPTPRRGTVRVRLSFPTDGWRIDRVALAAAERAAVVESLALREVRRADGAADTALLRVLSAPDESYLITEPAQRVTLRFDAPAQDAGRTYLLASQGYYIEWLRPEWVRRGTGSVFQSGDAALLNALRRWHRKRASFERQFYSTAIPVH